MGVKTVSCLQGSWGGGGAEMPSNVSTFHLFQDLSSLQTENYSSEQMLLADW